MNVILRGTTLAFYSITMMLTGTASIAQNFSVDTTVTQTADPYNYSFTLNYDNGGAFPTLTAPIYDWSFTIEPGTPLPTNIVSPTGWKSTYDPTSGEFDWYTEGPNGFGNGDFGNNVIQPGASLSGFGLTTTAAPDQSVAFATDEQFNQDATIANLPTTVPVAAPEPSTWTMWGIGALAIVLLVMRRRRQTGLTYPERKQRM